MANAGFVWDEAALDGFLKIQKISPGHKDVFCWVEKESQGRCDRLSQNALLAHGPASQIGRVFFIIGLILS